MSPLLQTEELKAGYGSVTVVNGMDLEVNAGEVVVLLGANGVGKTTTLLTLAGDIPPLAGTVLIEGRPTRSALHRRARRGLGFVTEERSVFMGLTTEENLKVGKGDIEMAVGLFPELKSRWKVKAGLLSGGEQQMLTLARAISRRPKLLLADELSLGLAPLVVDRLLRAVRDAADLGLGVLLVEQHVRKVLGYADRGYVIRRGRVSLQGSAAELRSRLGEIEMTYLASGGSGEAEEDLDEGS
jgi:ABC-type branched-subunit amino acid transport system ATPase component